MAIRSLVWPPPQGAEEFPQKRRALLREDSASELGRVIVCYFGEVDQRPEGPSLRVACTENHPLDAGINDCAGAHRAGFQRHIEGAARKTPAAQPPARKYGMEHSAPKISPKIPATTAQKILDVFFLHKTATIARSGQMYR